MSYNGSGTFQINTAGQPVITGTVISSTAFNALTADLATGLSTAITKDGQTATTARIPFAAGISSTLVTDSSSTTTGSIITAGGVGVAKALFVGTTANIAGVLSTTSPNITTSITTPSTSFNLINATATTLNLGGAATAVNVGAATGTMTVANTTLAAKAITASTTLGVTGAATLSSTLTYGGVTLTNAVTGTGKMVLDTSPTLTTPALGTPSALVLTNATGLPAAQLTGTQTLPRGTLPTGSVLQVVSVNKTDTFSSATTGAFTDITTFSIAITPTSSSSKILVLYSVEMGASHTSDLVILRLMRDSTAINIGALVGSRSQGTTANQTLYSNLNNTSRTIAGNFLDSPATTSSTTYKIQFRNNSGTFYLNRDGENTDNAAHSEGASNITVMEIAA